MLILAVIDQSELIIKTNSTEAPTTNLSVFNIEKHNKSILHDLRNQIDHPKDKNKLKSEINAYSTNEHGRQAIVVFDGFKPVGYVEIKLSETPPDEAKTTENLNSYAELARIGVLSEINGANFRKKGIGRKLMEEAEGFAFNNGKKGLWLEYKDNNPNAEPFYNKMGYKIISRFTDSIGVKRTLVKKEITTS